MLEITAEAPDLRACSIKSWPSREESVLVENLGPGFPERAINKSPLFKVLESMLIPVILDVTELPKTAFISSGDQIIWAPFFAITDQYFQNLKASPFLPYDDCPAIVEIFGNQQERVHLVRQYLDAEGDLLGDNESSILDPGEVSDMESIIRDHRIEIADEKARQDALIKQIQDSRN